MEITKSLLKTDLQGTPRLQSGEDVSPRGSGELGRQSYCKTCFNIRRKHPRINKKVIVKGIKNKNIINELDNDSDNESINNV